MGYFLEWQRERIVPRRSGNLERAADNEHAHPSQGGAAKPTGLIEPAGLPNGGGRSWQRGDPVVAATARGPPPCQNRRPGQLRPTQFFDWLNGWPVASSSSSLA